MLKKRTKIFVAMSGGVDSSVAAALLRDEGYSVTGVFIKVWQPEFVACTWDEDRRDAMRVCAELKIPFLTFDLSEEYKKEVVEYMVNEYKLGRTPNPDVMCNTRIKFGSFLARAKKHGADMIATGHHARVQKNKNIYSLMCGLDTEKDQSYFLWTLTQDKLRHTMFPIGKYTKTEVRNLAKKFMLPTADKKDSQGLCFIGEIEIKEFLKNYVQTKQGNVLDKDGNIIGSHDGAIFYTLGQRHDFTVTKKLPTQNALYVVEKDMLANTITVLPRSEINSHRKERVEVEIKSVNWIHGHSPSFTKRYKARLRYRQSLQFCKITKCEGETASIAFDKGQEVVPPGQSLVLYDKSICLGGGVIV